MRFNDLDLYNWRELDINTDSLWVIKQRDKTGKHKNIYHGNFIPQIPNQLIQRYTKQNETIFEPFMGSGTTLFECEKLTRKYIGIDINPDMIDYVNEQMQDSKENFIVKECNALDDKKVDKVITQKVQFVVMHPPYMDIVKFTDKQEDLSQINNIQTFVNQFKIVSKITMECTNEFFNRRAKNRNKI